jgi:DNA-binding transcriptional LysR family regulator
MDLQHLRYFQAVAEELSYSRAARRLRVAQPTLSRAVKEVEAALAASVLERSRHHVRLTPAGSVLLREIAGLLDRWEESMRRVRRTAAGERFDAETALRIGLVHEVTDDLDSALAGILAELGSAGPRAARHAKRLVLERPDGAETARRIAERRSSEEGQEGLAAFLERRRPSWASTHKPE